MHRRWVWWVAIVSALLLIGDIPARAVDVSTTSTTTPSSTDTTSTDGSPAASACTAKAPLDPAVWERALPVTKVSSDMTASDPGCVREVGRTADRVVWRNPDKSLTARTYSGQVNFKATDGSWQPIDTRLRADGEGRTVNRGGPLAVRFAGDASASELVRVGGEAGSVSFRLDGVATAEDSVIAPSAQSSGVVSGDASDTITYSNALPGVDVRYQMLSTALKEAIVLNQPLANGTLPEFRFSVTSKGLRAQTTDDGTIQFVDSDGQVAFVIPVGQALDATGAATPVSFQLVSSADPDVSALVVSVDEKWLSDPNRQFPVTIDPTVTTVTTGYDADIASLHADTNYSAWGLWNGDWPPKFVLNTGWDANEEFYGLQPFDLSGLAGAAILSAKWWGYAHAVSGATSVPVTLKPINAPWGRTTVTWNTQPAVRTNAAGTGGFTADSWKWTGIKTWVQNWVSGTWANHGIELRGHTTDDDRRVQIAAAIEYTEYFSYLEINYDAAPTLSNFSAGGQYAQGSVRWTQPTLSAEISDTDTATGLSGNFQLWNNATCTGSVLQSGPGSTVTSGQDTRWPLSSAVSPGTYSWKVNGTDGLATSVWSACQSLVIDTTAPNTPTASISGVTENTWLTSGGSSATATFGDSSTDMYGFKWGLDVGDNPTTTALWNAGISGATVTIKPTWGWHDLAVRAIDKAGNVSSGVKHFKFGWGLGGFATPQTNATTQQRVTAQVNTTTSYTGIKLQWRRADAETTWTDIPVGPISSDVQIGGVNVLAWPVTVTPDGSGKSASPNLVWNAASTAGGVDGPLQLRAGFYQSGTYTYLDAASIPHLTLNQSIFGSGFAAASAGPGSVNLLTGNLELSASDVSLPGGTVSRTFQSRAPNATGSVFGPGWSSSIGGAALFQSLVDNTNAVVVTGADGTEISFAKNTDGSYASPAGSTDLTLTKVSSTRFELKILSFVTYGFTKTSGSQFQPTDITDESEQTSTTTWQVVDGITRPNKMAAPPPAGVDCSSTPLTTPGCQTVEFDYAAATPTWTATTLCGSGLGDYAGQLRMVKYTAWDPHKSGGAGMVDTPVNVATYCYDNTGHLRATWDPRVSPALKTQYAYNTDGQIATLTPPGVNAWNFTYAPLSGEATGTGRLRTVYRAQLSPLGNATTTFAYRVPLTTTGGPGGPYDLDAATVARWGQHDLPTDATAVFPPSQLPSNPPTSYTAATVYYMNVDAELVNVAEPGGYISTTEHDSVGNVVRTLTAGNRQTALASSADAAAQAAEAGLLDSQDIYDATGMRLVDSFGPAHMVTLPDATRRLARAHAQFVYDEGAPGGGTFNLVTTKTESAKPIDASAEQDQQTTTYDYTVDGDASGWDLGTPLQTTLDYGTGSHLNLKTRTFYDVTTGQLTERWLPKATASGTPSGDVDKYKTQFVYYTAGTNTPTSCGGKPEWSGLLCYTKPAAQPGTPGLPDLAISQVTAYSIYGQPETIVNTNGSSNRTTTIGYDPAGRQTSQSVSGTGAGAGAAVPPATTAYNSANGLPTTTSDSSRTITRAYDALGRLHTYQDADTNTSTYTYDLLDRIKTLNDGKGTATYSYGDSGSEARGLPTTISYGSYGGTSATFAATFDANGTPATQTYPGGLTASYTRDEAGQLTNIDYAKSGNYWPDSTGQYNIHGQQTNGTVALSAYDYSYDGAGRLTHAMNVGELFSCPEQRAYVFDADTNRTQLQETVGCSGAQTTTTTNSSYDAADRVTTSGYSYDAFGRTTAVPATDSSTGSSDSLTYYVNDLVKTITNSGTGDTITHNLDPNGRLRTFTSSADPSRIHTNHYTGDDDSPAWTSEVTAGTTWTRWLQGFNGMGATVDQGGAIITLQLASVHGDIIATVNATATSITDTGANYHANWTDEYGIPLDGGIARYDYLGAHQRKRDVNSGLQLMGVRVYNPATGRFLQTDPVIGGSCNSYEYTCGDPVNARDLSGRCMSRHVHIYGILFCVTATRFYHDPHKYTSRWEFNGFITALWTPFGSFYVRGEQRRASYVGVVREKLTLEYIPPGAGVTVSPVFYRCQKVVSSRLETRVRAGHFDQYGGWVAEFTFGSVVHHAWRIRPYGEYYFC